MPTIPNWLVGRHATAVQARIQTYDASTGTLADSGGGSPTINDLANVVLTTGAFPAITFTTGLLNRIRLMGRANTVNVSSVQRDRAHHIPTTRGYSLEVEEVLRRGADQGLLANLWFRGVSVYVHLTFARGGNKWDDYFLMTGYRHNQVRGKTVGVMTLTSVDAGGMTYTAADR